MSKVKSGVTILNSSFLKNSTLRDGKCYLIWQNLETWISLSSLIFFVILSTKSPGIFSICTRWNHLFIVIWIVQSERKINLQSNSTVHTQLLWATQFILQTKTKRSINWADGTFCIAVQRELWMSLSTLYLAIVSGYKAILARAKECIEHYSLHLWTSPTIRFQFFSRFISKDKQVFLKWLRNSLHFQARKRCSFKTV